jgi:hypothetical protein
MFPASAPNAGEVRKRELGFGTYFATYFAAYHVMPHGAAGWNFKNLPLQKVAKLTDIS